MSWSMEKEFGEHFRKPQVMNSLRVREKSMVILYFGLKDKPRHTYKKIAELYSISPERVRQIILRAGVRTRKESEAQNDQV